MACEKFERDLVVDNNQRILSFDNSDRTEARHPFRHSGGIHRLDDIGNILVRVRHLFGHGPAPLIARNDSPARHLLVDIDIMAVFLGLRPTHNSPSAMAGAAERFLHGGLGTD